MTGEPPDTLLGGLWGAHPYEGSPYAEPEERGTVIFSRSRHANELPGYRFPKRKGPAGLGGPPGQDHVCGGCSLPGERRIAKQTKINAGLRGGDTAPCSRPLPLVHLQSARGGAAHAVKARNFITKCYSTDANGH